MRNSSQRTLIAALALVTGNLVGGAVGAAHQNTAAPKSNDSPRGRTPVLKSLRLYVFDCGQLHVADPVRFRLKKEDVPESDLSVSCFLIAHPKGTLMWDAGAVPDAAWTPASAPVKHHIVLPDSQTRDVTMTRRLQPQLAALGFKPSDITYLALSHYHYDHTANANDFAGSTWLVRQAERDAMFAPTPPGTTLPSTYAALRHSKTVILKNEEHDVFADGTVVIKHAPGHTPGHQILLLKLPKTGAVVLSGDLYHYPQMRTLDRVATFDWDQSQTRATRTEIDAFLKRNGAQLWIQHDLPANRKLRKSPDYYE